MLGNSLLLLLFCFGLKQWLLHKLINVWVVTSMLFSSKFGANNVVCEFYIYVCMFVVMNICV